jgi:hypothetical protein
MVPLPLPDKFYLAQKKDLPKEKLTKKSPTKCFCFVFDLIILKRKSPTFFGKCM